MINGEISECKEDKELSVEDLSYFKYAPIVPCDVERSFSKYKRMLCDNRMSFKFGNLKYIFITSCWYLSYNIYNYIYNHI